MNTPPELETLRDASVRLGLPGALLDPRLGGWVRALAAAKPGGTLLHVAERSADSAVWMRSGMDLASRLIVVTPERERREALEAVLGGDLQITCHRQRPDAFLDDVRAHRFDLIVHDGVPASAERIDRLWEVLAPGGLLFVPGLEAGAATRGIEGAASAIARRDDAAVALHAGLEGSLLAARTTPRPAPVRRGGRRARREPGAVTALRRPLR